MDFPLWLKERLMRELPGRKAQIMMLPKPGNKRYPIPLNAKKSSILLLFYPDLDDYSLIAIKRSIGGGVHSGQIAFPGGKIEPFDESPEVAALREANEEVALNPDKVEILGRLSPLYIPVSNFSVQPIVAYQKSYPDVLVSSKKEVADLLCISLSQHLKLKSVHEVPVRYENLKSITAPGYQIDEQHFLWGASAMILSEFEYLWKEYNSL